MTVKRNSRNVSTLSCTFKGKNLRKHLFLRKRKKLKTADLYLFMEIMNHWSIIPLTGYVNNTLRQILPYRVDREMSEKHCPSIPQNFTSAICSGDKMCLYDYFTTGDTFIANHTRESSQQYSTNTDVLSKGQGFRFFYGTCTCILKQYLYLVK